MVRADHKVARNRLLKRLPTGPELGQSTRPKSRRVHELGSSYECRTADFVEMCLILGRISRFK